MGKINGCLKCVFFLLNAVFGVRSPVLPLIHSSSNGTDVWVWWLSLFILVCLRKHPFPTKGYNSVTSASDTNNSDNNMVNGLHLTWHICVTRGHPNLCTILPHNKPFIRRQRCQPCKATASSSGAVKVRCLAQGHLDNRLGGAGNELATLRSPANPLYPLS